MRKPVILKIKKYRNPNGGGTKMTWPSRWVELADRYQCEPIALEDTGQVGEVVERAIGVVNEDVFDYAIEHPDIDAIDVDKANAFGKQWRPDVTVTTDEQQVHAILRKVAKGQELNAQDRAAIDENDKIARGVAKKTFEINNYL